MADFGGFNVPTPQEVLAGLAAQSQQIQQIRDPATRRNANIQFQIANLFGNPELRRARQLETRMKDAQSSLSKMPSTGTSLGDERRRLGMMFDAVKNVDPNAASQIQARLVELEEMALQQRLLQNRDDRAERQTAIAEMDAQGRSEAFARAAQFDDMAFAEDLESGELSSYDLTDPLQRQEYEQAVNSGGILPLTQEQAFATRKRREIQAAQQKAMFNNSTFAKVTDRYRADIEFLKRAKSVVDLLGNNMDAATNVSDIARITNRLAVEGQAAVNQMRALDGSGYNEGATRQAIREKLKRLENYTQLDATDRARYEGAILNMGYVLARSLDSGGRLSDQDVNMAIAMLTGGLQSGNKLKLTEVNPRTVVSVLLQNAKAKSDMLNGPDAILFSKQAAEAGNLQASTVQGLMRATGTEYTNFLNSAANVLSVEEMERILRPGSFDDPEFLTEQQIEEISGELEDEKSGWDEFWEWNRRWTPSKWLSDSRRMDRLTDN